MRKTDDHLIFKCTCGCLAQFTIQDMGDGQVEFNTREDGRRNWMGVVIDRTEVMNIIKFLEDYEKDTKR